MQRIFQVLLKSERYVTAATSTQATQASHSSTKVRTKYSINKDKIKTKSHINYTASADLTTTASKPALTTNQNYCEKDKSHGGGGSDTFDSLFNALETRRIGVKKPRKPKRYSSNPDLAVNMDVERDFKRLEAKLSNLRQWEHTPAWDNYVKSPQGIPFTLLSYNILAQNLLEAHPYLYKGHDNRALPWNHRNFRLIQEILSVNPQILCLQEMQESHLAMFEQQLSSLDLSVLYKKRTGFKDDGCAIFYNHKLFNLIEYHTIEYYQPNCQVSFFFL